MFFGLFNSNPFPTPIFSANFAFLNQAQTQNAFNFSMFNLGVSQTAQNAGAQTGYIYQY